ncbi:hypothetical protein ACA910_017320 [Epithemia clementina (nom. ined.)]
MHQNGVVGVDDDRDNYSYEPNDSAHKGDEPVKSNYQLRRNRRYQMNTEYINKNRNAFPQIRKTRRRWLDEDMVSWDIKVANGNGKNSKPKKYTKVDDIPLREGNSLSSPVKTSNAMPLPKPEDSEEWMLDSDAGREPRIREKTANGMPRSEYDSASSRTQKYANSLPDTGDYLQKTANNVPPPRKPRPMSVSTNLKFANAMPLKNNNNNADNSDLFPRTGVQKYANNMPNPGDTYGPYTKDEDLVKSANNMPNPGETYGPYTKADDGDMMQKSANNMPNPGDTYGPYTKNEDLVKSANNMPNPGETYGPYTKRTW